jgi:hypothetical protein
MPILSRDASIVTSTSLQRGEQGGRQVGGPCDPGDCARGEQEGPAQLPPGHLHCGQGANRRRRPQRSRPPSVPGSPYLGASSGVPIDAALLVLDDQHHQASHRRWLLPSRIAEVARQPKSRAVIALVPAPEFARAREARTSQAAQLVAQSVRSHGTDARPLAPGRGQSAPAYDTGSRRSRSAFRPREIAREGAGLVSPVLGLNASTPVASSTSCASRTWSGALRRHYSDLAISHRAGAESYGSARLASVWASCARLVRFSLRNTFRRW